MNSGAGNPDAFAHYGMNEHTRIRSSRPDAGRNPDLNLERENDVITSVNANAPANIAPKAISTMNAAAIANANEFANYA